MCSSPPAGRRSGWRPSGTLSAARRRCSGCGKMGWRRKPKAAWLSPTGAPGWRSAALFCVECPSCLPETQQLQFINKNVKNPKVFPYKKEKLIKKAAYLSWSVFLGFIYKKWVYFHSRCVENSNAKTRDGLFFIFVFK